MSRMLVRIVLLVALSSLAVAQARPAKPAAKHRAKPSAVKTQDPPKPVPIPAMTPEQLPAQPPLVSFTGGELSVESSNATLNEVLTAIKKQTGLQIDAVPGFGNERVATHLSGAPRDVITQLMDGSKFGYIIVGSPTDPAAVQRLIVTSASAGGSAAQTSAAMGPRPGAPRVSMPPAYTPPPEASEEEDDSTITDRNPPPQAEQPQNMQPPPGAMQPQRYPPGVGPNQPNVAQPNNPNQQFKTPDQLLRELQRMRQQQNPQNPPE